MKRTPLIGDWKLWPEFAVRSAGFPVDGLHVFGLGDEPARLRGVARNPRFREAVGWQNAAALANALDKVAAGSPAKPSDQRRREAVVASYWQRYCAKNDTIGFFGPLAWGRIDPGAPPLQVRGGSVEGERSVHFEGWAIQALAESLHADIRVPLGPWPERDLRATLEALDDAELRGRGLAALRRLEAARAAAGTAGAEELPDALARLDDEFTALTGRDPTRNHGRAYGARTLAYIDSMRDVDVTIGRGLLGDLTPALAMIFEATRWYSGAINEIGKQVIADVVGSDGGGPFGPLVGPLLGTMMSLPGAIAEAVHELQDRIATLLRDPDPETLAARAAVVFADHKPTWRHGIYQSADIQLAAASADAVGAGDYLAVIADVHPGDNPLVQGLFAHRMPDPTAFDRAFTDEVGEGWALLMPPWGAGMAVDARGVPRTTRDTIHIAINAESLAPTGCRTWRSDELRVEGAALVDAAGELQVPLADAFSMPIFVMGVRTWEPFADADHTDRLTLGRVVLRRETWNQPAGSIPTQPDGLAAWARDRRMPRRVFVKTPAERKPFLFDLDSPALTRIGARHIRQAAAEQAGGQIRFSEMLPGPDACWLTDEEGRRYASELRLVAVDGSALGGGRGR